MALTMSGPMEMFGTKWPSMTSTWIQSAPAASTARTSSPSLAKSAARIDGAMMSGRCTLSLQINVRVTRHVRTGNAEEDGPGGRQNLPAAAPRRQILACFRRRFARKIVVFHRFAPRPRFCIDRARRALVLALRVQEYFMSFSVNGSNANNPFAQWQSLLQQDSSTSSSAQSDPIASLLAALGQGQNTTTGATASSGGASSSSTS